MKTFIKSILFTTLILLFNYSFAQTYYGSGAGTSGGNTNSYYGYNSGANNIGPGNTFIGAETGIECKTGHSNAFLGAKAGFNSNSHTNTFLGAGAGENNKSGFANVFVGAGAGQNSKIGSRNVYLGLGAGAENEEGSNNVFVGDIAGWLSDGSQNVYIGKMAGWNATGHWKFILSQSQKTLMTGDFVSKKVQFYGNVGIDVDDPQHKLEVCGTIRAEEVKVEEGWCDYVFEQSYDLPTLEKEEAFINDKGHLLSFQSAAEMDGEIQLGDITKRQQETIEKLMLYTIELNKELKALKEEVKNIK